MKINSILTKAGMLAAIFLFVGNVSKAEVTYNCYTANEHQISPTVFEFDVYIQSTGTEPFRVRTVQNSYTFNPAFINGATVTVGYVPGSSQIPDYNSRLTWSSSGEGFTSSANIAGTCWRNGATVPVYPASLKVATYRLTCISGQFGSAQRNISMVKMGQRDPANDMRLKMAVTKWNDPSCAIGTNTTIAFKEASASLGVNNKDFANGANLFPNPTVDKTTLSFTAPKSAKYIVKMYDPIGHLISTESISAAQGYNSKEMDMEKMAAGMYTISIQTDDSDIQTLHLVVK